MGQGFLLDTNTIIDFCGNKLPQTAKLKLQQIVDIGFFISPIVQIEVLGFNGLLADMQKLEGFLKYAKMLNIDFPVIQETINLRKQQKIKLGDAIIAATVIVINLHL